MRYLLFKQTIMKQIYFLTILLGLTTTANTQNYLLGPQAFNTDIVVHGTTAPNTSWFAPNYNTPIDFISSGGCTGSCMGFSGSWNNYWGNFLRLPQVNCTSYDTILMTFNVSNSFFASQSSDWCRLYIWADNAYKHNVISIKINGIDVTYDSGVNGKGFKFSELRNCDTVQVLFNISAVINKSNILFYLEPSCGYNNSNIFMVKFDNIAIIGGSSLTSIENDVTSEVTNDIIITADESSVIFNATTTIKSIRIFTMNGKLVYYKENINTNLFTIDNKGLLKGQNIVQIESNGKFYNKTIAFK